MRQINEERASEIASDEIASEQTDGGTSLLLFVTHEKGSAEYSEYTVCACLFACHLRSARCVVFGV